MSRPVTEVASLGVLQGLTEFLPVSSSGHLALAEILFGLREAPLTLNVMLHGGTLLATIVVLRQRCWLTLRGGLAGLRRPSTLRTTLGGRDALFVIVASVPTALVGLLLRGAVERWTSSAWVVGCGFMATTGLLLSTRWARAGQDEVPSVVGAVLIGLAQGIAVVPGVSRSGATICAALWLRVAPTRAFELSMLASIPAVLGAVLLQLRHLLASFSGLGSALFGALIAFAVGVVALLVLRGAVDRGRLPWFALWTMPLAIATLALARALP